MYELERKESETRINDYNPLLLMLWKANIDVQFVADDGMAITTYITDYLTKAERSHIQQTFVMQVLFTATCGNSH